MRYTARNIDDTGFIVGLASCSTTLGAVSSGYGQITKTGNGTVVLILDRGPASGLRRNPWLSELDWEPGAEWFRSTGSDGQHRFPGPDGLISQSSTFKSHVPAPAEA